MENVLRQLVETISLSTAENREITYSENAIGITALIFCPLKVEFRRSHPEIKSRSTEIDDGYLFEKQVKEAATRLFGKRTLIEPSIPYESRQNVRIEGHPDLLIIGKKKILVLECKAPNFLFSNISGAEDIIFCKNGQTVSIPPHYLLQSRIQKFLVQNYFTDKEVIHYIFAKALIRRDAKFKKAYIFHETQTSATKEEMEYLIEKFLNEKSPRYPWECRYCPYREAGLCQGKDPTPFETRQMEIPTELKSLISSYAEAYQNLKEIEAALKDAFPTNTHIEVDVNGRKKKIGWITKTKHTWDLKAILRTLKVEALSYLQIKPHASPFIEEALTQRGYNPDDFRKNENQVIWRGL